MVEVMLKKGFCLHFSQQLDQWHKRRWAGVWGIQTRFGQGWGLQKFYRRGSLSTDLTQKRVRSVTTWRIACPGREKNENEIIQGLYCKLVQLFVQILNQIDVFLQKAAILNISIDMLYYNVAYINSPKR